MCKNVLFGAVVLNFAIRVIGSCPLVHIFQICHRNNKNQIYNNYYHCKIIISNFEIIQKRIDYNYLVFVDYCKYTKILSIQILICRRLIFNFVVQVTKVYQ